MSDETVFPLDEKEQKGIKAQAHEAGMKARLKWAQENLPIDTRQAGNAGTVAVWLMTAEGSLMTPKGKARKKNYTFKDFYEEFLTGSVTIAGSIEVRVVERHMPTTLATFNLSQARSLEDAAIQVARGLCTRTSLDEIREVSKATWAVHIPHVHAGPTTEIREFLHEPSRIPSFKAGGAAKDMMLIAALETLGFSDELNDAYDEAYERTAEDQTKRLLRSPERTRRLERKQGHKESLDTAVNMAKKSWEFLGKLHRKG